MNLLKRFLGLTLAATLAVCWSFPVHVEASRDFSKNTSNYINLGTSTLGTLLNGASSFSVHAWAKYDTVDGTNDAFNRILSIPINGTSDGFHMAIGAVGATSLRIASRSVSTDTLQFKKATTGMVSGTWYSCGAAINISGDTITPYLNGASEGGGSVTFNNATYTQGTPTNGDAIGAQFAPPADVNRQFDGRIAEIAVWDTDIGTEGFATLAKGFSARNVRPDRLVFYMPLVGRYSPEQDFFASKSGSITGSVPAADHPRIIYPRGRR